MGGLTERCLSSGLLSRGHVVGGACGVRQVHSLCGQSGQEGVRRQRLPVNGLTERSLCSGLLFGSHSWVCVCGVRKVHSCGLRRHRVGEGGLKAGAGPLQQVRGVG